MISLGYDHPKRCRHYRNAACARALIKMRVCLLLSVNIFPMIILLFLQTETQSNRNGIDKTYTEMCKHNIVYIFCMITINLMVITACRVSSSHPQHSANKDCGMFSIRDKRRGCHKHSSNDDTSRPNQINIWRIWPSAYGRGRI